MYLFYVNDYRILKIPYNQILKKWKMPNKKRFFWRAQFNS